MTFHDRHLGGPHDRALELAAVAVDFELTPAEATELEAHLAGCPACARRATAIRADAQALRLPVTLLPSPRIDAAVRAQITRRGARPHRLLLLAAAVILLVALLATMAVGSSLLRTREGLPVSIVPDASPTAAAVVATAAPSPSAAPSDLPVDEWPTPVCPAPSQEVVAPVVSVSAGHDQGVVATPGSYTTATCSTTGVFDAVPREPGTSLAAYPGDTIQLTLPVGWRFVSWEGSHRPTRGDGGDSWQHVALPEPARSIDLPGPLLTDEVVSLTVVIVSDDARAVIELGLGFSVNRAVS